MELAEHIQRVRQQLLAAAALGDERTQQIAQALSGALESAIRLELLAVVSAATSEVTAGLFAASGGMPTPAVTAHLEGDEIRIGVTPPPSDEDPAPADDGDATARISLRLSDNLKSDIERAASRDGLSVNSWLVRAAVNAVGGGQSSWLPPSGAWTGGHPGRGTNRITGWVSS
jgi:hypothetical protein